MTKVNVLFMYRLLIVCANGIINNANLDVHPNARGPLIRQ
jgi:hypothetical protein